MVTQARKYENVDFQLAYSLKRKYIFTEPSIDRYKTSIIGDDV